MMIWLFFYLAVASTLGRTFAYRLCRENDVFPGEGVKKGDRLKETNYRQNEEQKA